MPRPLRGVFRKRRELLLDLAQCAAEAVAGYMKRQVGVDARSGIVVSIAIGRVWVFLVEIPDGGWGASGQVRRLPDILAHLVGERERQVGEERLAASRRERALAILEAVGEGSA